MEASGIKTDEFIKKYLEAHGIKPTAPNKRAAELIMSNLSDDLLALISDEVERKVSDLESAVQQISNDVNKAYNQLEQVEKITGNFKNFFDELVGSMSVSSHAAIKTYTFMIGMAASYKDPIRTELMKTAHDVLLFMLEHPESQKEGN